MGFLLCGFGQTFNSQGLHFKLVNLNRCFQGLLKVRLSTTTDAAWKEREAAVMALGAVAEGCISGLLPHLSRAIAQATEVQVQFDIVLTSLLRRILNSNKHVQEAARSAFATFE